MPDDELRSIVERMLAAGESEADIAAVIRAYGKAETPPPGAEHLMASHEPEPPPKRDVFADIEAQERERTHSGANLLPAIGGAVGAAVGGGIPGGTVGGYVGSGLRQLLQRGNVGGAEALTEGVAQGVLPAAAARVGPALRSAGRALKPRITAEQMAKGGAPSAGRISPMDILAASSLGPAMVMNPSWESFAAAGLYGAARTPAVRHATGRVLSRTGRAIDQPALVDALTRLALVHGLND